MLQQVRRCRRRGELDFVIIPTCGSFLQRTCGTVWKRPVENPSQQ